jgi:hypothetical protein
MTFFIINFLQLAFNWPYVQIIPRPSTAKHLSLKLRERVSYP